MHLLELFRLDALALVWLGLGLAGLMDLQVCRITCSVKCSDRGMIFFEAVCCSFTRPPALVYRDGATLLAWDKRGYKGTPTSPVHIISTQSANRHLMEQVYNGVSDIQIENDVEFKINDVEVTAQRDNFWFTVPSHLDRVDQRALPLDHHYDAGVNSGANSIVYVLDSGIYADHIEFEGRVLPGWSHRCLTGNEPDCGISWYHRGVLPKEASCSGHGTHCASVVAGAQYGIAPRALIKSVQVLDCSDTGTVSGVLKGIEWAVNDWNVSHPTMGLVLSLSLDVRQRVESMNVMIDWATSMGATVVVAAGNDGADSSNTSPCSAETALCVGASTPNDKRAEFSNFGTSVNIYAVGTDVLGAWSGDGYRFMMGTSMATPAVAGAIAQLKSWYGTEIDVAHELLCASTRNPLSNLAVGEFNRLLFAGAPLNEWIREKIHYSSNTGQVVATGRFAACPPRSNKTLLSSDTHLSDSTYQPPPMPPVLPPQMPQEAAPPTEPDGHSSNFSYWCVVSVSSVAGLFCIVSILWLAFRSRNPASERNTDAKVPEQGTTLMPQDSTEVSKQRLLMSLPLATKPVQPSQLNGIWVNNDNRML